MNTSASLNIASFAFQLLTSFLYSNRNKAISEVTDLHFIFETRCASLFLLTKYIKEKSEKQWARVPLSSPDTREFHFSSDLNLHIGASQ